MAGFEEDTRYEEESHPCECGGEITKFNGIWSCYKCGEVFGPPIESNNIIKYEETQDKELLTVCPHRKGKNGQDVMVASCACCGCFDHNGIDVDKKGVDCGHVD